MPVEDRLPRRPALISDLVERSERDREIDPRTFSKMDAANRRLEEVRAQGVPVGGWGRFGQLVAVQPTRGFRTGNPGNRLKSLSADQSSRTPCKRQSAATLAS